VSREVAKDVDAELQAQRMDLIRERLEPPILSCRRE
jgi:hypothetical protein